MLIASTMDKFLIRKPQDSSSSSSKRICVDLNNLPSDPGLREKISMEDQWMNDCLITYIESDRRRIL